MAKPLKQVNLLLLTFEKRNHRWRGQGSILVRTLQPQLVFALSHTSQDTLLTLASCSLLLAGVPKHLSYNGVKELILAVDGVLSVHSLHVWSLTMNQVILSVHIAAGQ